MPSSALPGPDGTPFLPVIQTDLPALVVGAPRVSAAEHRLFQHSVSSDLCLGLLACQSSVLGSRTLCEVVPVSCRALSIPGTPVSAPPPTSSTLRVSNERPVSPAPSYCPAGETEAQTDTQHFLNVFIYLTCMSVLPACVPVLCSRMPVPLELEVQVFVRHHVGSEI